MKIAVTATEEGWDSQIDERFGRAATFAIVTLSPDGDQRELTNCSNTQNLQAAQGAGIQAAATVSDAGVEALLTGHVGPKAFKALEAGGIRIYTGVSGTVKDAVDGFLAGKYKAAQGADVRGHW